ncbi:MAG: transglutaminase domain-containing protein, partial [Sandaracinaceae bacterium]|nr:transglutaminase domain-containing protein [Sandaracinaceae bacterium]
AYYFRQDAFSQFNGNRLVRATLRGADPDIAPGFPVRPLNIEGAPSESILRSSVETTVGMLGEHARPFGLEAPVAFIPATNPNPSRFRRVYRVRSAALTADPVALLGRRAGDPSWSEELWRHYTRAPDDPRYLELAHSIVSSLPSPLREDPYAQALAISNWLSKNGIYSLRSKHAGAPDPTADFLFGDRKGYCIHFAHAAAFLMRSLGLPARVGTGYVYPEAARRGGSAILLSAQNGHAWAELYLQGVGWVVVDVFPEQSLDEGIAPPDEDLQRLLAEMLRGNQILPEDGSEPPVPIEELTRSWLKQGLVVLGFAFLAIVLAMYFIKAWRSLIPLFARPENRARLELRAALDRLAELGIVRPRGLSREAFAVRLAADFPSLLPLCKLAEATHFGNATPPHSDRLRALRTSLSKERSRKAPLWRRILAWLDPLSWLQAR